MHNLRNLPAKTPHPTHEAVREDYNHNRIVYAANLQAAPKPPAVFLGGGNKPGPGVAALLDEPGESLLAF